MKITCNKCGATYRIDPNKITAPKVKFKCKSCNNHIIVHKKEIISNISSLSSTLQPETSQKPSDAAQTKLKGFGIRFKLFSFLIILIAVFAAQAYYLILQLNKTAEQFGKQGTSIIKEMAENDIMKTAQSVAKQVKLYLDTHPELVKEQFMNDEQFRQIAVQKVGKSGYTALYGNELDGKWRTRAHIRPNICAPALDDMAMLEKPLGVNFPEFWKILTAVTGEQASKGYYQWQEKDKSFKNKYMACVNVAGTRFNIASTTYLDDFTKPMQRLKTESMAIAKAETLKSAITTSVIIIIIAIIVFLFGGRLTANIKYLSQMTDRISLGDLDALIKIRSKDELAVLAESISRLQQSVKLSIQRLRKK